MNQDFKQQIRRLVPLDSLNEESFDQLIDKFHVEQIPKNRVIFEEGDTDEQNIYLLEGELLLSSGEKKTKPFIGGEGSALYALSNLKPRRYMAKSVTPVVIASIGTSVLEQILNWDHVATAPEQGAYEVSEVDSDSNDSWMFHMMQTERFMNLPAANIYSLFSRFEPCQFKKGDVVIREGDHGDYYYIIKQGSCEVSMLPAKQLKEVVFDSMDEGDAFGEEALISDRLRNATITMTSDGTLMRLSKEDFRHLLQEPLLRWVDREEVLLTGKADAKLLDIRLEDEFDNGSIKGASNLPLYRLRMEVDTLDKDKDYIVFCDSGARSASAAYLLTERGYSASILKDGLSTLMETSD